MSNENRRDFSNLMVLCHRHHVEIDSDVETYTAESLRTMKLRHEASVADSSFTIGDDILPRIEEEIRLYWANLERINRLEHAVPDLAIPIDAEASALHVVERIETELARLHQLTDTFVAADEGLEEELKECARRLEWDFVKYQAVAYYERPFFNRNWEVHNLGVPNSFTKLAVLLRQLKIRVLEMALRESPNDEELRSELAEFRDELEADARSTVYAD